MEHRSGKSSRRVEKERTGNFYGHKAFEVDWRLHLKLFVQKIFAISLAVFAMSPAMARQLCLKPLPADRSVEVSEFGLPSVSKLLSVPDFDQPFLDFGMGSKTILTVADGKLRDFTEAPMSSWNRLFPTIISQNDDTTWAYTNVRPALFLLDPETSTFVRHPISDTPGLRGFSHPDWRREHEDRTIDRRNQGDGPIYAYVGDKLFKIVAGELEEATVPPTWTASDSVPIDFPGVGVFAHVKGQIWFRRSDAQEWHMIASIKDLLSLHSQSPFSIFQVRYERETGSIWVMLEDRVLVGRLEQDSIAPELDYQFAGDVILHPPSGKILVWAGEALTDQGNDSPRPISGSPGLWEMSAVAPTRVPGFQAQPRLSNTVPLLSTLFHDPTQTTIVSHAGGFAAFDGEFLRDLAELTPEGDRKPFLRKVAGRYFMRSWDWLAEITDDLDLRPIPLPQPVEQRVELLFSPKLKTFILHSAGWETVFTSTDLVSFHEVQGDGTTIIGVIGEMPGEAAVLANSKHQVFLIHYCE